MPLRPFAPGWQALRGTSSTARAGAMSFTFLAKSAISTASKSTMGGTESLAFSSALRRR